MSTSTSPMSGNGVGIANYLFAEKLAGYHFDGGDPNPPRRAPGPLRRDEIVFRADQILGTGATQMGIDLSRGLTLDQFSRVFRTIPASKPARSR